MKKRHILLHERNMNLEIRTTLSQPIPALHFSELLALAIGDLPKNGWFERHLIDPRPMLSTKQLMQHYPRGHCMMTATPQNLFG